ncbi:DUF6415 family natural product biosynthesis protein [Streptomyces sp. NPDC006997]|uniref:DUF6415 family natural product biosynthesis protein n=1 Tax=Streptomyces sp. NPDC006997 TaxID=3155356 RepID=UPI0033FDA2F9
MRVDQPALDVHVMQADVRRLLAPDAESPSLEELEALALRLRGHIMVTIPAVEAAQQLPEDDSLRACALLAVGEARRRLDTEPHNATLPAGIATASGSPAWCGPCAPTTRT